VIELTIKRWIGNAAAIADIWTVTLSGTVISQTYTLTINTKSVSYAASATDTVATIVTALASAWNATTIPEFAEYLAAGTPSSGPFTAMAITAKSAGTPGTITFTSSGSAAVSIANTSPGTGPSDFTNSQNWSGGVAPTNADTLVFDNGSVPCACNLGSALTGVTISVEPGYSGAIGLPFINANGSSTYAEYRTTSLTLAGGTATVNSGKISRCNLAFGANTATVRVLNTGPRPDPNVPTCLITGGNNSSSLNVSKGDLGVAFYQGTSATFPTINTAFLSNVKGDVTLVVGVGGILTTVTKNGGSVTLRAGATTVNQQTSGGVLSITDAATITTLNATNGTVNYQTSGILGTINLYGASVLDCSGDSRAKTVTNPINVFDSAVQIIDPMKTINSGVLTLTTADLVSVEVNHGANTSIVYT
jgi:hypothetical protein